MSKEPKPDGWHIYHVCHGTLRSIKQIRTRETSRTSEMMCVVCGDWCRIQVTPELVNADTR